MIKIKNNIPKCRLKREFNFCLYKENDRNYYTLEISTINKTIFNKIVKFIKNKNISFDFKTHNRIFFSCVRIKRAKYSKEFLINIIDEISINIKRKGSD